MRLSVWQIADALEYAHERGIIHVADIRRLLIPLLAKHLEEHRNGFPAKDFIFTGEKLGRPLDLHNLARRVVQPALRKANIPWCGFHGFRRGLATNLKTLGVDDLIIKQILRHSDVAITRKSYIKIEGSVRQDAMSSFKRASMPS